MELRIREYKPHKTKKEGYVDAIPKRSSLCTYVCKCNDSVFLTKCDLIRHTQRDCHKQWLRCLNCPKKSPKVEVQAFPICINPVKRLITDMSLQRAKSRAIRQIRMYENEIIMMFNKVAKKTNTNSINTRVRVDIDEAIERCRSATLKEMKQYGICDEINVCISSSYPMTDSDLVATIMHESMHYICKVDRGYGWIDMCTRDEHEVFRRLGEDW